MKCPECGSDNLDRALTCWRCDAPLTATSTPAAAPMAGLVPVADAAMGQGADPLSLAAASAPSQPPLSAGIVNLGMVGANPQYIQSLASAPPPTPPTPQLGTAPPPLGFAGAYGQYPAYAAGAAQPGVLPAPPPTYPRVQPYVPTYRPREEPTVAHAGFLWRLAAWALDTLILNVAGFIIGFPIGVACGVMGAANGMSDDQMGNTANFIAMPLSVLVAFLYCTLLLVWRGQTVGMMACSLKVVHTDGMPIGFGTAALRWICYFIAALPCGLGLLWMLWDPESQGWHDKLAGTYVVRVR